MPETLRGVDAAGLERSCDSIRIASRGHGIERTDVHLRTFAFEPHRHDTYAIGITTHGVQRFRYRGADRVCLPGQLHVLHPDETHDGRAGSDDGFGYRILYIAPSCVREALGGRGLPFVADPVQRRTPALVEALRDVDDPIDDLAAAAITAAVADALASLAGVQRERRVDVHAAELAREYLDAHPTKQTTARTLETVAGVDRYALARHFRRAFGTSPDRYRALRRIERAKDAMERGESLVRAAALAGFADQSHLTRQFRRAYGLTPGRWLALTRP
jgi:AraC-like DNA-binding protein